MKSGRSATPRKRTSPAPRPLRHSLAMSGPGLRSAADSKLICNWFVGGRDAEYANDFMDDLAARLNHRVQLTTDGHKAYLNAIEGAFGTDIDYASW